MHIARSVIAIALCLIFCLSLFLLAVDFLLVNMCRQVLAILGLVERTVESREEEHQHLSAHTGKQHEVGTRKVGELEECTENYDRRTPAIGIVEECLSGNAIHPLLQMIDYIELTVNCHCLLVFYFLFFLPLLFTLDVLAKLRTQRKPI